MTTTYRWIFHGSFVAFVAASAALVMLIANHAELSSQIAAVVSVILSGGTMGVAKMWHDESAPVNTYQPKTFRAGKDDEDEEARLTRSGSRDNVRHLTVRPDDPDLDDGD